ncbi:MAG: right-handed parallel beta-helix repeat-containing protein [Candidatus Hydrogenedentes bacterium]|nr:right-handed parallel beta-helix repeat-containing protein [Candidatus Hydrogenedentota bacterium]
MIRFIFWRVIVLAVSGLAVGAELQSPAPAQNSEPIAAIAAGTRTDANAAWWGFNAEDSTEALQSAIDSGAKTITVPYVGAPWIVRPIKLRSNLELLFEPGVLVLAKKGEFKGKGDSLFSAEDMTDITVRGYGATLRMHKKDYQSADYEKAEWRMGFAFDGCKRVLVEGVRVESSGGDGFYIGATAENRWCEDVTLRNCVCVDHHRQGLSVISAQNLLVENCVFSGTSGTAPQAGIDLEPNAPEERLVNCHFRNCTMENNAGSGILVYLKPLRSTSEPVSIRFENCVVRMGSVGMTMADYTNVDMEGSSGVTVAAVRDDGPQGLIEFVNCTTENTAEESLALSEKSAKAARVRFENCRFGESWVAAVREYSGVRASIMLMGRRPDVAVDLGGVEFADCHVYGTEDRPAIAYVPGSEDTGLREVSGTLTVHSPVRPEGLDGQQVPNLTSISLEIVTAGK